MNILFIGDIVAKPGRQVVNQQLGKLVKAHQIEFVIANGENTAGGLGITPGVLEELLTSGIDVITSGNHIWKRKEVSEIIEHQKLLRPANYPDVTPGKGFNVYKVNNIQIAVLNIQGRIFMDPIDCPFSIADKALDKLKNANIIIVDFHAEATSEKIAMGWYLDGKVTAVIGTHTHVQTSDGRILPGGTAYISDAGMTGSKSGVIGIKKEEIIKHFLTRMPFNYKSCKGDNYLEGIVMEVDEKTGRCEKLISISLKTEE